MLLGESVVGHILLILVYEDRSGDEEDEEDDALQRIPRGAWVS